jgi:hypothetical protein
MRTLNRRRHYGTLGHKRRNWRRIWDNKPEVTTKKLHQSYNQEVAVCVCDGTACSLSLEGRDAIGESLELWSLKQNVELGFCSTASDCFPECSVATFFVPPVGEVLGLR